MKEVEFRIWNGFKMEHKVMAGYLGAYYVAGIDRYPRSVQVFASDKQKTKLDGTIHPTQKPLALMEMLVKSYTDENDMVLDNTCGSGTLNLACLKLNRKSIGIEKEKQYYNVAVRRLSSYCG